MINRGINLIVTTSPDYLEILSQCIKNIQTLGEYTGNITVYSDLYTTQSFPNTKIIKVDIPCLEYGNSYRSRWLKTKLNELTPYQENLYLDVDVLALKSFDLLWNFLKNNDICFCLDQNNSFSDSNKKAMSIPTDVPYFNGGVIIWRQSDKSKILFSSWHKEWLKNMKTDQIPLSKAISGTGIVPYSLPVIYNTYLSKINSNSVFKHVAGGNARYKLSNMKG